MKKLATLFSKIFKGADNSYGTYEVNSQEGNKLVGRAITFRKPVTELLWEKHLAGENSLGIVPINEQNKCFFGAIDVDIYPIDLKVVCGKVKELELPLVPCKSKSGGVHLYLFIRDGVDAVIMQSKLKEFAIKLGYGDCEIFPKQIQVLHEKGDVGSWINMPYFNFQNPTRYGLHSDGSPMDVEDFLGWVEKVSLDSSQLIKTVEGKELLVDGPPCLQAILSNSVSDGSRNNVLLNLAIYVKKADPENILPQMAEYNELYFKPSLPVAELVSTVKSASRKDYDYTCEKNPLKKHCNKAVCRTKKFGISPEIQAEVALENLVKFNTEPPMWFVTLIGPKPIRLELTTEELQNQHKFQTKCLETANIFPPMVKKDAWSRLVQELLSKLEVIEAPKDTSPRGQFYELLEEFCTARVQAKTQEELLLGKPWLSEGHHYIRLANLMSYLKRKDFKAFELNEVAHLVKEIGGKEIQVKLKGKKVDCWKLKAFDTQTSSFEVQGLPKKETM